jgi:SAM-dependent methyltransferase
LHGRLAVELAKKGFDVIALDGFKEAAESANSLAKREGIAPLAGVWDFTNLPQRVGDRPFHTVLALDLLIHVVDDAVAARELHQVLLPGGRLILTAPAFPALQGKRDRYRGHLRRYSRAGLRSLLESAGFKIDRMCYWNFLSLPMYVLIEKVFNSRLPDKVRYVRGKPGRSPANELLTWWFTNVENRLWFPCGLTFFVIAHKPST